VIGVWRWELIKIGSLVRSRLALGLVVVVPFLLALGLQAQSASPSDTLFGRFVHESGFALPLVVLGFSSQWVLPLLVAVVAGDVLTGEDHLGTWPLLTTRATSRRTLLAGKVLAALTWTVLVVALLAASSLLAGLVVVGDQPVVGLSGALLGSGQELHQLHQQPKHGGCPDPYGALAGGRRRGDGQRGESRRRDECQQPGQDDHT
jgi:ABC-2 type transport system permease protein